MEPNPLEELLTELEEAGISAGWAARSTVTGTEVALNSKQHLGTVAYLDFNALTETFTVGDEHGLSHAAAAEAIVRAIAAKASETEEERAERREQLSTPALIASVLTEVSERAMSRGGLTTWDTYAAAIHEALQQAGRLSEEG